MARRVKKTRKMREVEDELGVPLEEFLPLALTEYGLTHTADLIGKSKATLGYWLLKLDIRVERIALGPEDTHYVNRATKTTREDILGLRVRSADDVEVGAGYGGQEA